MSVEKYLPARAIRDADRYYIPEGGSSIGVQLGDLIIHSEDSWGGSGDKGVFTLVDASVDWIVDDSLYPEFYALYENYAESGVLTMSAVPDPEGGVGYKWVADLQEG